MSFSGQTLTFFLLSGFNLSLLIIEDASPCQFNVDRQSPILSAVSVPKRDFPIHDNSGLPS